MLLACPYCHRPLTDPRIRIEHLADPAGCPERDPAPPRVAARVA